jgi:hypothetical protein
MPAQISASLLATYLAAASRQVTEDSPLSDRSRWAIDHAMHQLQANRDVLAGEKPFVTPALSVGVRQIDSDRGPDLAQMALQGSSDGPAGDADAGQLEQGALARLDAVLGDLETLAANEGSTATTEAAERLSHVFVSQRHPAAA